MLHMDIAAVGQRRLVVHHTWAAGEGCSGGLGGEALGRGSSSVQLAAHVAEGVGVGLQVDQGCGEVGTAGQQPPPAQPVQEPLVGLQHLPPEGQV